MINSDSDPSIEKDISKVLKVDHEYVKVFGIYDAILKVKYGDVRELAEIIRAIPKIHSVMILTLIS